MNLFISIPGVTIHFLILFSNIIIYSWIKHIWCFSVHCSMLCSVAWVVSNSLQLHRSLPNRLLYLWDYSSENTGVGCHALLQEIFPTQGSNLHLFRLQWILSCWATREALQSIAVIIFTDTIPFLSEELFHLTPESFWYSLNTLLPR